MTALQGVGGILQCGHSGPWARGLVRSTEGVTEVSKEPPSLGDKNPDFCS